MKEYLITYSDGVVLSIVEAPEGAEIACGTEMIIDTLENAKPTLLTAGIDIAAIIDFEQQNQIKSYEN